MAKKIEKETPPPVIEEVIEGQVQEEPMENLGPEEAAQVLASSLERVSLNENAIAVVPVFDVATSVKTWREIVSFIKDSLVYELDYGVIPGTTKPTLYKSGAERLNRYFGFTTKFIPIDKVLDWTGKDHGGEPFFYFEYRCEIYLGQHLVAWSDASANSWETKHRYRNQERECPECGANAIMKSKYPPRNNPQAEPGWYCYDKKGGCKANFDANDTRITGQEVGQGLNPNPADLVNTIQKMAQKRSFVGTTILATGTGGIFTQDLEDYYSGIATPDDNPGVTSQLVPNAAQAEKQGQKAAANSGKQSGSPAQSPKPASSPQPQQTHSKQSSGPSKLIQWVMKTAAVDTPAAIAIMNAMSKEGNPIYESDGEEAVIKAVGEYLLKQK